MTEHLLPQNATELEKAFSLASNPAVRLDVPVTQIRGIKLIGTPPPWLPFLVYEYGLGELTPYVPNLYELIDEGIDWQRVRGTPDAIARGLDWVGYAGTIEEAPIRRTRWHLFQLELDRVRDDEEPDLFQIEGITQLSVPIRSHFWRGYRTYDVRATEYGWKKWSGSLWSSYSGARIRAGGAKWSFGRIYELDHTMTEAELTALGVWIGEVTNERPYTWENVVWPHVTWRELGEQERRVLIIDDLAAMSAWATFLDADDNVIGHRRARVWRPVKPSGQGAPYRVGSAMREPATADATGLYFEAMTDFGDGFGSTAAKWQIRLGATLVDTTRPGLLWAEPDELTGGTVAVEKTDAIEFGRTVRERCRALLRIA
jgi:hypothetical protein